MRTHQQIDHLNLELARAVAAKLRRHPELFESVVVRRLKRWRANVDGGDPSGKRYLEHWEALAKRGLEVCLAQVVEESEQATALRQASPFAGVLDTTERMQVIRAWRGKE